MLKDASRLNPAERSSKRSVPSRDRISCISMGSRRFCGGGGGGGFRRDASWADEDDDGDEEEEDATKRSRPWPAISQIS